VEDYERIEITCNVEYRALRRPSFHCQPESVFTPVNKSTINSSESQSIVFKFATNVTRKLNDQYFSCHLQFNSTDLPTFSSMDQGYSYQWISDPITITCKMCQHYILVNVLLLLCGSMLSLSSAFVCYHSLTVWKSACSILSGKQILLIYSWRCLEYIPRVEMTNVGV
jgi:hypothetical protein